MSGEETIMEKLISCKKKSITEDRAGEFKKLTDHIHTPYTLLGAIIVIILCEKFFKDKETRFRTCVNTRSLLGLIIPLFHAI